jgi:hypothetical protein
MTSNEKEVYYGLRQQITLDEVTITVRYFLQNRSKRITDISSKKIGRHLEKEPEFFLFQKTTKTELMVIDD